MFDLTETPAHTGVCLLVDKEEIGSDGVTGMQSHAFDTFMADLCRAQDVLLDEGFENSVCLSADVCNAFDPNYPEVSRSATMRAQTAASHSSSTRAHAASPAPRMQPLS